jgi:methionine-gamma-lyase
MKGFDPIEAMADARHEFGEHGGVNMSIESSTTFTVMHADTMPSLFQGRRGPDEGCYLYGRHFNPTVYALGRSLAAMENTEAAYATASGMSAIAATVMQLCEVGDHAVVSRTIYGGTFALFREFLPKRTGLRVTFVDASDPTAVEAAMEERTKLVFCETMSNPTLSVPDLPRLAEIAHRHGAQFVVDNTFCPMMVTPSRYGADIVVHSMTKFVSGASDVIAGAICGSHDFLESMMDVENGALMLLGPTMDPNVAFQLQLRLPHLGMRMKEHSRRAQFLAERLADSGYDVIYPGLPAHPQHALLEQLLNPGYGHGGLLALDLRTADRANALLEHLQNEDHFGFIAVSLGYFESLISCSATSTSSELTEEEQAQAGISPGLLRISVGYTGSVEQRWVQLQDALSHLERTSGQVTA